MSSFRGRPGQPELISYGLKAVEAIEYRPYGVPTIHSRASNGAAQLRFFDDEKLTSASGGLVTSNTREGEALHDSAWLSMADSPIGATDSQDRVANSAALSSIGWKHLYTARAWTPVSETYYYRARWYAPELGRFISRDPIGYAGGLNQYMYVGGNPINFVDPTGLVIRDLNGNIVIDLLGVLGELSLEGGTGDDSCPDKSWTSDPDISWTSEAADIKTDEGRSVRVFILRIGGEEGRTNCHGFTFADGIAWINPREAAKIIEDEYELISNPSGRWIENDVQPGDVVIFGELHNPVHSAKVSRVNLQTGIPLFYGLGGAETHPKERTLEEELRRFPHPPISIIRPKQPRPVPPYPFLR